MKFRYLLSFFVVSSIIFAAACSENVTGTQDKVELPKELTTAEKSLVETGHSFSFDIFQNTVAYEEEKENIFISPLSISVALGMTMNGAKGETYEEMRETLAFHGLDMEEINSGYKFLIERLKTADPEVKMEIANSVWSREGFTVEDDFLENIETYFDAEANELDFNDPESVDVINKWVEDNTGGLIDEIIKDNIPAGVVMYLINALYFKGNWTHPFDEDQTREAQFHLENGDEVTVDMMNKDKGHNTFMSDEVRMVDLPYGDSLYSMTLMMPADPETKLDEFIANKLTFENFNSWVDQLSYKRTVVSLPKFELEYEVALNDVLKSMGMEKAFTGEADFTGINSNGGLSISEVKHKTFVTVDEKGTEAAAVTSVGVIFTSAPPSFNANRPFVFVIREQSSGAIVFMGKVKNPDS